MKSVSPPVLLKMSYASEEGDILSDLGSGRVLIRNPNKPARILDRRTGAITEDTEFRGLGWDIAKVVIPFIVFAAAALYFMHG